LAAKRITWAKYLNAGQTCVSPHYIYVHQDVVAEYIRYCKHYINEFYSDDPKSSEYFGRIVSTSHCRRLVDLIDPDKVVHGGKASIEERYLEPTIIGEVTWEDPIMQAEIFGPVMPVLTFSDLNEGCSQIRAGEKPLALYIYSEQKSVHDQVLQNTSSGGACINDSLIHVANHRLPFGGVGNSGMGSYHGKKSFDLLSHHKSIHPADGFTSPADKTRSTTSTLAKLISLDTTQPAAPQTRPPSQLSKPIRALTKRAAPCPRRRPPSSGRSQNEVRRFKEIRSLY
jgi:aldehyde dehydrogenase (NAD+)